MYASIRRVVAVCAVALVPFMGCSDDDGTGASAQADGAVANTSNRLIKMVMQGKGDKPEHRVKTEIRYKYDSNGCVTSFDYYYDGTGTLYTFTRIDAAPTGFEDEVPYTIAVVELAEGGRALAWLGESLKDEEVRIGMDVQIVPRIFEETEDIRVYYTVEQPGTTWGKAPPPLTG